MTISCISTLPVCGLLWIWLCILCCMLSSLGLASAKMLSSLLSGHLYSALHSCLGQRHHRDIDVLHAGPAIAQHTTSCKPDIRACQRQCNPEVYQKMLLPRLAAESCAPQTARRVSFCPSGSTQMYWRGPLGSHMAERTLSVIIISAFGLSGFASAETTPPNPTWHLTGWVGRRAFSERCSQR